MPVHVEMELNEIIDIHYTIYWLFKDDPDFSRDISLWLHSLPNQCLNWPSYEKPNMKTDVRNV